MEFIPPIKNKSLFVIYIAKQDNGIVTASGDYIGNDPTVRRVGLEALDYLYATSELEDEKIYISKVIGSLRAQ